MKKITEALKSDQMSQSKTLDVNHKQPTFLLMRFEMRASKCLADIVPVLHQIIP